MPLSSLARIAAGLAIGAAMAAFGLWLGTGKGTEPDVADTPQPSVRQTVYLEPGETVVGPNLLIPIELEVRGTELALQYEIVSVAPPVLGVEID
ncbi:MAG: hypothetical protein KJN71_06395, partial [Acidimicrobiia bacterium]|nr:hypothetical protein [Acidimicrobiia bacterium]